MDYCEWKGVGNFEEKIKVGVLESSFGGSGHKHVTTEGSVSTNLDSTCRLESIWLVEERDS